MMKYGVAKHELPIYCNCPSIYKNIPSAKVNNTNTYDADQKQYLIHLCLSCVFTADLVWPVSEVDCSELWSEKQPSSLRDEMSCVSKTTQTDGKKNMLKKSPLSDLHGSGFQNEEDQVPDERGRC